MDTLTHALSGALVARLIVAAPAPARAATPPGGVAAVPGPAAAMLVGAVAGAFPDIDAVARFAGDLAYLRHHRGVTHSVLLAPLWALGLAWLMARWPALRRAGVGWRALYAITLSGLLIHIAGDWITQFGTMLLAPFSDARFGLGAMFIIDLVFSGILLGGVALAALRPRARWPSALALAGAAGWVVLAWVGRGEALDAGRAHAERAGIEARWVEAMPRPASPFNWSVVVFDGARYHLAHLNTRRTEPLVATADDHFVRRFSAPYAPVSQARWEVVPRFGEAVGWVPQAFAHEAFATFRWFSVAPALVQAVERPGPRGAERCAFFRDLRFEFPGREEAPFRYGLCMDVADPSRGRVLRLEGGEQRPV